MQLLYDVGSNYKQVIPTLDFTTTGGTGYYAIIAGHSMRKCYLGREAPSHDSSGWAQIWRLNNSFSPSDDSGYVFYNGNYSPAAGMAAGSAFIRVPAYRFTMSGVSDGDWTVSQLKVRFKDHGTVLTSGRASEKKTNPNRYPVFAKDASAALIPASAVSWKDAIYYWDLGVFNESTITSTDPRNLINQCQASVGLPNVNTDACNNAGASNGFPLWRSWPGGQMNYSDGTIINAPNSPKYTTWTADAGFRAAAGAAIDGGHLWLTFMQPVGDSGQGGYITNADDYPSWWLNGAVNGVSDWWLCQRVQIDQLQITLSIDPD